MCSNVDHTTGSKHFCHTILLYIETGLLSTSLGKKSNGSNQNGGIKNSCSNMGQVMSDYHQVNEFTEASHRNEMVQQGSELNYNQCMC